MQFLGVERKRDKSVKDKAGEETNGESAVGSGIKKYPSSFLPQGVGKHILCSVCVWKGDDRECELLHGNLDTTSGDSFL